MKDKLNKEVDLSEILHKYNSDITGNKESAVYLYLASRSNFFEGEQNSPQKMYVARFLSDKLLKDIITEKSLPKEVIKRAQENKNFTRDVSPSQYRNLSKNEERDICINAEADEVYDVKTRQTCLEIAKRYLSRTYLEENQSKIMKCLTESSTQDIASAVCAEGKMGKFLKKRTSRPGSYPLLSQQTAIFS